VLPDRESLLYRLALRLAGGRDDLDGRNDIESRRNKWLRRLGLAAIAYLLLPLAIFEFTESGPRPRLGMPCANPGWDISGDFDHSESAWPFVVWKPVCVVCCRARGFELPASWR
jgi:hypothetical protein